jgi:hypothetical protein
MYDHPVSAMPTGQRAVVSARWPGPGLRGTQAGYPVPRAGSAPAVDDFVRRAGIRGWHLQGVSLGSIALCVVLWIRAKTVDQDERANAERRALFVGLWPPMFWLIGDTLDRRLAAATRARRLPRVGR